jgi:hypothetical protein
MVSNRLSQLHSNRIFLRPSLMNNGGGKFGMRFWDLVRQLYLEMIECNDQAQMDKAVLLVSQAAQCLENHRLLVIETKRQVFCVIIKGGESLEDWEDEQGTVLV